MHFPKSENLPQLLEKAEEYQERHLPFVLYKKPLEHSVKGIFQKDDALFETADFEERGFVMAPFGKNESPVLIIPDNMETVEYLPKKSPVPYEAILSEHGQSKHEQLLTLGKQYIEAGKLKKVVLSRTIEADTPKKATQLFERAIVRYPNAFCYLWYHPQKGLWLGATPETLLRLKADQLQTVALAGTLKSVDNTTPEWSSKEREEQKMVTNFITDCLKDSVEEVKLSGPKSFKAGKLWHLRTEIHGTINKNFSLSQLLNKMHPTPAVCGVPKEVAYDFINQNEGYQREYYTGFLGELNLDGAHTTIELFVNLRCMKYHKGKTTIYVGGGITSKSDVGAEWQETQNKSQTMLELL